MAERRSTMVCRLEVWETSEEGMPRWASCSFTNWMVCRVDEMKEELESMTADRRPRPPSDVRSMAWFMAVVKASEWRRELATCGLRSSGKSGLERM